MNILRVFFAHILEHIMIYLFMYIFEVFRL